MEIVIVLIVLAVIAAAAFLWMRSRNGAPGLSGRGPARRGLRGDRGDRHAMATDPHEPATERRLREQANRVEAVVHARQAAKLESQAGRGGRFGGRGVAPADPYGQPAADAYGQPAYDDAGQPMYVDGQPVDQDGQPLPEQPGGPVSHDEHGRPIHPEDRPRP